MKKLVKVVAVLLVVGAVLTAVLAVAVKIFLTPEKAKALLQKEVAGRLHREMKLGSVDVGLFSGLAVTDFALSERPNFDAGTFVATERFVIRPRLLPLLAKQFLVRDIELIKPAINVVRNADGTFNFSDITGGTPPAAAPATSSPAAATTTPAPAASPLAFVVSSARIDEGHLTFVDRSTAALSTEVRALNLKVKNFTLTGPMDVDTDLTLATKKLEANVLFQGVVNPFNGTARIKKAQVTSGVSSISAAGEATELLGAAPHLDLTLTLVDIAPAQFSAFLPMPASTTLGGTFSADVTAKGTLSDLVFVVTANAAPLQIAMVSQFQKPAGVPLSLAANGEVKDKSTLTLSEAKVTLSSMSVVARGTVSDMLSPHRRLALSVETSNLSLPTLARFVPAAALPSDIALAGPLALTAEIKGTIDAGTVSLSGDAGPVDVRYADSFHKPANAPLSFSAEGPFSVTPSFETRALRLTVGGLILEGPAAYHGGKGGSYSASLKSNTFPLESVASMAPAAADYAPAGPAQIAVHVVSGADGPSISGTAALKGVSAKYERTELTQLTGTTEFTMDSATIPSLKGKWNGSDLSLKVNARAFSTHPVIAATIDVGELDINRLLPAASKHADAGSHDGWRWAGLFSTDAAWAAEPVVAGSRITDRPMDLSGSLTAGSIKHDYYSAKDLKLTWNVTNVTPALTKINGVAALKQGAGTIENLSALIGDSKTAKILLLPVSLLQKLDKASGGKLGMPSLDHLPFKSITGDYKFKAGTMEIVSFNLDSDVLSDSMTGTVGLAGAMPLDVKTVVLLAGGLGSAAGLVLGGNEGKATLNITVTGTASDPKPALDKQATAKQIMNAVKSDAGKNFLKKFGIDLGGSSPAPDNNAPAPSGGAAPSGSSPAPAAKSDDSPTDQIQNVLKGLFKKK